MRLLPLAAKLNLTHKRWDTTKTNSPNNDDTCASLLCTAAKHSTCITKVRKYFCNAKRTPTHQIRATRNNVETDKSVVVAGSNDKKKKKHI